MTRKTNWNDLSKVFYVSFVVFLGFSFAGCAINHEFYGAYEKQKELYLGTVDWTFGGKGSGTINNMKTHAKCDVEIQGSCQSGSKYNCGFMSI